MNKIYQLIRIEKNMNIEKDSLKRDEKTSTTY